MTDVVDLSVLFLLSSSLQLSSSSCSSWQEVIFTDRREAERRKKKHPGVRVRNFAPNLSDRTE